MQVVKHKGQTIKLDKFLTNVYPNISYSYIQKLLRLKDIKVNNKRVNKIIEVNDGDEVVIYADEQKLSGKILTPNIVFEDDNIIVVDKPSGIETTSEKYNDLLLSVNTYLNDKGQSAAACHRLDRNTRGLVVFAKTNEVYGELTTAFKNRTIDKYYLALVYGKPSKSQEMLKAFLFKDAKKSKVLISDTKKPHYEPIETWYKVVKSEGDTSLLEVKLITGKTHQIRAHLAHVGLPLVGDGKYGKNSANKSLRADGQALVAYKIKFNFVPSQKLYYLNNQVVSLKNVKL